MVAKKKPAVVPLRNLVAIVLLLLFAVICMAMIVRTLGSVLVCILDPKFIKKHHPKSSDNVTCDWQQDFVNLNKSHPKHKGYTGSFKWSKIEQGNVISGFEWAHLVTLPICAILVRKINPSFLMVFGMLGSAASMAVFPVLSIRFGWVGGFISRLLTGAFEAFAAPSSDAIAAVFIPANIKSFAYSVVMCGADLANLIVAPLSVYFCPRSIMGGWSATYYCITILTGIWAIAWVLFHFVTRNEEGSVGNFHNLRSKKRTTIRMEPVISTQYGTQESDVHGRPQIQSEEDTSQSGASTFLKDFYVNCVQDPAVWGIYASDIAATWTVTLFVTYIPQFYLAVLHVSLKSNGTLQSIPFVIQIIAIICCSILADVLKKVTPFSASAISRAFNAFGFIGCGVCIFLSVYIECLEPTYAVILICLSYAFYAFTTPGFRVGYISVNPGWAGVISAVCKILTGVSQICFAYIYAGVVKTGAVSEWKMLFALMFAVDLFAALVYGIFGSVVPREERGQQFPCCSEKNGSYSVHADDEQQSPVFTLKSRD